MKKAVLLAYFTEDALIAEFYNSIAIELHKQGFLMEGIDLKVPSKSICDTYKFSLVSFEQTAGRRRLGNLFWKMEPLSKDPLLLCYAKMQSLGASGRVLSSTARALARFKKLFRKYLVQNDVGLVVLNHQFSGHHLVARDLCLELGIKSIFWHPGFLPGTMCFDSEGQLAESEINRLLAGEIDHCGATQEAIGAAYRRWVLTGSYSRPGKSSLSDPDTLQLVEKSVGHFKKVILVVGANDYRSGLQPECYSKAKIHGPGLSSSDQLFHKVAEASDNTTLVVYKPHPNTTAKFGGAQFVTPNSCRIFDVTLKDLFRFSDLVVTVCSTGIYEAMLFGVPSMVAGNLPGCRHGICYVADGNTNLEKVLKEALENRVPPAMTKKMDTLFGCLLSTYFFSSGSAACPLVERGLALALREKIG